MDDNVDDVTFVVGIGNPNIDFIVEVPDDHLLCEYGLLLNSQSEVPYDKLHAIKDDAKEANYFSVFTSGGCTQNSLVVFQRLAKSRFQSVMLGAVGKDENAERLCKTVEQSGVITEYVRVDNHKTTEIVILIREQYRTAAAYVDAGRMFTLDCLTDRHKSILNKAPVIMTEGFFVANRPEVCDYIMDHYGQDKIMLFNIAATYIFRNEVNAAKIIDFSKQCDIVVGNQLEFITMVNRIGWSGSDIVDLLKKFHRLMLSKSPSSISRKFSNFGKCKWEKKLVIVTDGDKPVYFIFEEDDVLRQNVFTLPAEDIVDTTGAGDSFVAGLLYGLVNDYDIRRSVRIGCRVAAEILKQYGVVLLADKQIDLPDTEQLDGDEKSTIVEPNC